MAIDTSLTFDVASVKLINGYWLTKSIEHSDKSKTLYRYFDEIKADDILNNDEVMFCLKRQEWYMVCAFRGDQIGVVVDDSVKYFKLSEVRGHKFTEGRTFGRSNDNGI
jgi:tricorn protease-like protein